MEFGKFVILQQKLNSTVCSRDSKMMEIFNLVWAVKAGAVLLCFWPLTLICIIISLVISSGRSQSVISSADSSWAVTQHVTDSLCFQLFPPHLWPRFIPPTFCRASSCTERSLTVHCSCCMWFFFESWIRLVEVIGHCIHCMWNVFTSHAWGPPPLIS